MSTRDQFNTVYSSYRVFSLITSSRTYILKLKIHFLHIMFPLMSHMYVRAPSSGLQTRRSIFSPLSVFAST